MKTSRLALSYVLYSKKYNSLNLLKHSTQYVQMPCLSNLLMKSLHCTNNSHHLVSHIFSSIFNISNIRYLCIAPNNNIESLSNFIISKNDSEYESETVEELRKILNFLLGKGYKEKEIKDKFLPYLSSCHCSYVKFNLLADIYSDIHLMLPLLSLSVTALKLAAKQAHADEFYIKDFPNRISYLSHHLELSPNELIPALVKHSALLTMNFKRLEHKMKILKNANISSKYIVKDLWIFNYNEKLLAVRIQNALDAKIELKPWMLRCSEKFFQSILMKSAETQRILEGENVSNYLAKKLRCSTEYVDYMMERNKLLKSINIPKVEQIINFLFEKGYTPQEIRLFPRVFCSKLETLSERFEVFKNEKSTLPTISQLCISSKNFENLLKKKN